MICHAKKPQPGIVVVIDESAENVGDLTDAVARLLVDLCEARDETNGTP